jgi:YD repeat-containing protein
LRLEEISSVPSQAGEISVAQSYNSLNQIKARHENDGTQWRYNYDELGQLNYGKKYFNQGQAVAGNGLRVEFLIPKI